MQSKVPLVKLGEVLSHRSEFIKIDDLHLYKRVTAQLHAKGIIFRDEVEGALIKTKKQQLCKTGDFLVAEIDAKLGGFGIVPADLQGSIVSSHYFLFDIDTTKLDRQYLDFFIRTKDFQKQITAYGSTNYAAIRPADVLELEIPLPALEEQQRIIIILEHLMKKIDQVRENRKKAIVDFEHLFTKQFLKIYNETSEWNLIPIEDCCQIIIDYRGRTPPISEAGIPHITTANIKNGTIDWATPKFVLKEIYDIYMTRGIPKKDDVLFTMEAPLGETGIIPDNRIFSIAQRILLLRTKIDLIEGNYLCKMLMHPLIKAKILENCRTTTVSGISSKKLKKISIPVPSIPVQRRVVAHLNHLQAKIDEVKRLQAKTEQEMEALMPVVLAKAFGSL